MKSILFITIILGYSNLLLASSCEELLTTALEEEKAALKLETQSNKLLEDMFLLLEKSESNKKQACEMGELNKKYNIQSSEYYKKASKYYLDASKTCQGNIATMAKEKNQLTTQQSSMRSGYIKKMDKFLTTQCN